MGAAQLRAQIRELERQIRKLERNRDARLRQMEAAYSRRIQQIEARAGQNEARTAQRVREIREELQEELRRHTEALHRASQQTQQERERLLREIQVVEQELQRQIQAIQDRDRRQAETTRAVAEQAVRQAREQARITDSVPHNFFCPGRFAICAEHLSHADESLAAQMLDAALAIAGAAQMELELLLLNAEERQREWEEMYQIYEALSIRLWESLVRFEKTPIVTPCIQEGFVLNDDERAYWSMGHYAAIRQQAENAQALVEGIRQAPSVGAYLRGHTAVKGFQFSQQLTFLHRLSEQAAAVMTEIHSELYYSDQRLVLGAQAEELFHDLGYETLRAGFRGDPEDPMDCYEVSFSVNRIDEVEVIFVPQRKDGVVLRNVCILAMNTKTVPSPKQVRTEAERLSAKLKAAFPELGSVQWISLGAWQADSSLLSNAERQYKKIPDPTLLAQQLERRYW